MPLDRTNDQTQARAAAEEARIDETLAESFPASDPPSWTLGVTGADRNVSPEQIVMKTDSKRTGN